MQLNSPRALLPRERLLAHLSTIELLQSLYPLEGELTLDPSTESIQSFIQHYASSTLKSSHPIYPAILQPDCTAVPTFQLTLRLNLTTESCERNVEMELSIFLALYEGAQVVRVVLHQPKWLSRSVHAQLDLSLARWLEQRITTDDSADDIESILAAIEYITEQCLNTANEQRETVLEKEIVEPEDEVRVWYWFPSLSTRQKRDDMVNWAPDYGLTGFVLAGKLDSILRSATSITNPVHHR